MLEKTCQNKRLREVKTFTPISYEAFVSVLFKGSLHTRKSVNNIVLIVRNIKTLVV